MNQSPEIGSQQDFNKFVGTAAVKASSINTNPAEFDAMQARLTKDAEQAKATEDTAKTEALKDLAQYEANAKAPEGTMDSGINTPNSPEGLIEAGKVASDTNTLVRQ